MKPFINVFETFGSSATSPFAVWQSAWVAGWKMMDAWQQAWVPLLTPRLPGSGLPMNPMALFPNVAVHDLAMSMARNSPFAAILPQVEATLTPLGKRAGEGEADAARLSMRVRMPAMPGAADAETLAVEALIARQQGRERAALGCLEGARVVYPVAETAVPAKPAEALPSDVTRAAVKAVRRPKPKAGEAAAAKKVAAKAVAVAAEVAKKPSRKPAAKRSGE